MQLSITTRSSSPFSPPQATGSQLSTLIETFFAVVAAIIIAFAYSWVMTFFMICVVPLLVFGTTVQSRVLSRNIVRNKAALERAGKVAVDSIDNIRTVAGLGAEENFSKQYSERITTVYK